MKYSNCFIFAVHKWVTKGGWLIMRRSKAGPYPHFIHAEKLPEDLEAEHFVAKNNPWMFAPIFEGTILKQLGEIRPPEIKGIVDWSLLIFWVVYFVGIGCILYSLIAHLLS